MALYVFRLSLECPRLSIAELEGILEGERARYRIEVRIGEFVIVDIDDSLANLVAERAALIKEFGKLIAIKPIKSGIDELAKTIKNLVSCVSSVESVRSLHKSDAQELFRVLASAKLLSKKCSTKVVLVDGYVLIFDSIKLGRVSRFGNRAPQKRPAYLPGTMTPWLARVFVNLSGVSSLRHEVVLDPFCGVGGFALECGVQGIRIVCGDIDDRMVKASIANIYGYRLEALCDVAEWDASILPLRRESVDGIATDPPYGRMSIPQRYELHELLSRFIDEALSTLRKGRRAVFAVPLSIDNVIGDKIRRYVKLGLCKTLHRIQQYVHSSLTRVIYVVRKT